MVLKGGPRCFCNGLVRFPLHMCLKCCISLAIIVTFFAWIVHRLVSSNSLTEYASVASHKAAIECCEMLVGSNIPHHSSKRYLPLNKSVLFWYILIPLNTTIPGLCSWVFFNCKSFGISVYLFWTLCLLWTAFLLFFHLLLHRCTWRTSCLIFFSLVFFLIIHPNGPAVQSSWVGWPLLVIKHGYRVCAVLLGWAMVKSEKSSLALLQI